MKRYLEKDIEFVKRNINKMTYGKMANYLSDIHGFTVSVDAIRRIVKRNGIKRSVVFGKCKSFIPTKEHLLFLEGTMGNVNSWQELTDMFNEQFDENQSVWRITKICREQFGYSMRKATSKPIGTVTDGTSKFVFVKKEDGKWAAISRGRFVWEKEFGEMADNEVVVHLNGNKNDCRIDNLFKLTQKECGIAFQMTQSKNPDVFKAAVLYAKLATISNQ